MEARSGGIEAIGFAPFESAFAPLATIANVRLLVRQANAFARLVRQHGLANTSARDTEAALALGQCVATIAYAQLVAENSVRLDVGMPLVPAMFHEIVLDLAAAGTALLVASPHLSPVARTVAGRMVRVPRTPTADWDWVAHWVRAFQGDIRS